VIPLDQPSEQPQQVGKAIEIHDDARVDTRASVGQAHDEPLCAAADRSRDLECRPAGIVACYRPVNQNPILDLEPMNLTRDVAHSRRVYSLGRLVVSGKRFGHGEEIPLKLFCDRRRLGVG